MSTLYVIRHGQASFGHEVYDKLSERGCIQSTLLAQYLDRLPVRFDVVYTGTLIRHEETAEAYLAFSRTKGYTLPEVKRLPELNEFNSREILTALLPVLLTRDPALQADVDRLLTDRRSFQRVFEGVMALWLSGNEHPAGLMSWRDYAAGVNRGIDAIMADDGRGRQVAVFTSGGTIAATIQRVLRLADREAMQMAQQLVNTSVTRFVCTRERIMMASFNGYPHLELEGDASLITYR